MRRLLVPTLVLVAAILADWRWAPQERMPEVVTRTGWGIAALVFLLAWRFGRGRVAYAVVMFVAAGETLHYLGAEAIGGVWTALAVLLPVNLAVLAWTSDFRVWSVAGAVRWGVLAAQAGAVAVFAEPVRPVLERPLLGAPLLASLDLPHSVLLCFLLALLAVGVRLRLRPAPLEAGLLAALAAVAAALVTSASGTTASGAAGMRTTGTTYYLAAGMLALGVALVESTFALAFEDGLTGLPARRALEETLRHLGRRTYAIAMVDLDHFKKLNDRHGHEIGDQVLQMVAAKLGRVKGGGRAYRYGGEEFSVVFAGKNARAAEPYLKEMRRSIADATFTVRLPTRPKKKPTGARGRGGGVKKLKVTVSIGVAERSEEHPQPELVMKAADKALYRSKRAGRNRVTLGR